MYRYVGRQSTTLGTCGHITAGATQNLIANCFINTGGEKITPVKYDITHPISAQSQEHGRVRVHHVYHYVYLNRGPYTYIHRSMLLPTIPFRKWAGKIGVMDHNIIQVGGSTAIGRPRCCCGKGGYRGETGDGRDWRRASGHGSAGDLRARPCFSYSVHSTGNIQSSRTGETI